MHHIREMRDSVGLSQQQFANQFGIPVSTLRKWEQGESRPPEYVINLLAKALPACQAGMRKIITESGVVFYYNSNRKTISDGVGNEVRIAE